MTGRESASRSIAEREFASRSLHFVASEGWE